MSSEQRFQNHPKARLPRLYENPYETGSESSRSTRIETTSPAAKESSKRVIKAGAAVLGVVGLMAAAESKTTANAINSIINREQNAMTMPSIPKPEEATTITIGDTIEFKSDDGKTHKVKIETLSDITAAAQSVNPDIDYSSYDAMLESENRGSAEVRFGDKFTVDKSLGITDLGPSAN